MPKARHGKLLFRDVETIVPNHPNLVLRVATDNDIYLIEEFCNKCKELGFLNNQNLKNIKWDWIRSVGKYYIGIDLELNKIFTMAGYHPLLEIDNHSWRILFRGAQLPGYALRAFSKNQLRTSVHFAHVLYYQINDILTRDPEAKLYMSTNIIDNTDAPKSARLNRSTAPILEAQGLITLEVKDVELYYTRQNLWRINIDEYMRQRSVIYLGS